jgi:hypothetical protein
MAWTAKVESKSLVDQTGRFIVTFRFSKDGVEDGLFTTTVMTKAEAEANIRAQLQTLNDSESELSQVIIGEEVKL